MFIWNMLHNCGGARAIYGNLTNLFYSSNLARDTEPSLFVGTGVTMESIDQNSAVYSFMTDMAFVYPYVDYSTDNINDTLTWPWLERYISRRYSLHSIEKVDFAMKAWNILWRNS